MKIKTLTIIILIASFTYLTATETGESIPYQYEKIKFTDQDLQSISLYLGLEQPQEISSFLDDIKILQYNDGLMHSLIYSENLDLTDTEVEQKIIDAEKITIQYTRVIRHISRLIRHTSKNKDLKSFSSALKSTKKFWADGVIDGRYLFHINEFDLAFQYGKETFPKIKQKISSINNHYYRKDEL